MGVSSEFRRWLEYTYPAATAADTLAWLPSEVRMYDAQGALQGISASVYDASGNVVQSGLKDANGDWITEQQYAYVYHERLDADLLASSVDALGRAANFVYDATGRLTHSGIGAATTANTYRAGGNLFQVVSPEGKAVTYDYYANDRLAAVGIASETTEYGYGRLQYGPRLSSVTDAKDQWIGYDFDAWGRMTARRFYGDDLTPKASEFYHYDAWGRVDSFTDCNGDKTAYDYDAVGRMTTKSYVNSQQVVTASVAYAYNDAGQLGSITSYCSTGCDDTVHYEYDKLGRLLYRSGVGYGQIGFQRDAMGRTKTLQWMKTPDEPTSLTYNYDMAQRVTSVVQDGSSVPLASYSYDESGAVESVMLENGAYVEYEYDSTYGRLTALRNKDKYGTTFAGFEYTYDLDGLVASVTTEDASYVLYDYDDQNRLTDEWRKSSGGSTVYRHQYQYDDAGNRTQHIHTDNVSNSTTFTLTYNDLNQLTQRSWTGYSEVFEAICAQREVYSYDDNGNLIQKDEDYMFVGWVTAVRWEYGWDHENRLIQVIHTKENGIFELAPWKKVQFNYCPSCGGNRTAKVVWENENFGMGGEPSWTLTKWLRYETLGLDQLRVDEKYDADEDGLDEADPFRTERITCNGGPTGRILRESQYTYASEYSTNNPSIESYFHHYDRMMVVSALSDYSGTIISGERYHCDAFGQFAGSTLGTTRRITAKEFDADILMYYFHARWYQPSAGRFASRDPLPRPELTYRFGLYDFVGSNPIRRIDVDGLKWLCNRTDDTIYVVVTWDKGTPDPHDDVRKTIPLPPNECMVDTDEQPGCNNPPNMVQICLGPGSDIEGYFPPEDVATPSRCVYKLGPRCGTVKNEDCSIWGPILQIPFGCGWKGEDWWPLHDPDIPWDMPYPPPSETPMTDEEIDEAIRNMSCFP